MAVSFEQQVKAPLSEAFAILEGLSFCAESIDKEPMGEKIYIRFCLLIGLTIAAPCLFAARVIEVAPDQSFAIVSHPPDEEWVVGHALCISHRGKQIACGWVEKTTEFEAHLKIESRLTETQGPIVNEGSAGTFVHMGFKREPIRPGDWVEEKKPERELSAEEKSDFTETEERLINYAQLLEGHVYPVTAITLGLDFIFPTLHFQHALTPHFATGLEGRYVRYPAQNGEIEGLGGQLTFNWYGDAPYTGMFWKFGVGVYDMDAIQSPSISTFLCASAGLNVGWKWRWLSGVNFGFGIGAQYFVALTQPAFAFTVPGLVPSIALDVGFAF